MPIRSASVTVGSTAVALASNGSSTPQGSVFVSNMGGKGSGIIYIGDAQVTAASGVAIPSNVTQQVYVGGQGQLFAISNEASQTVRIIEVI